MTVKLQHSYDFLYCDYNLYRIKASLDRLSQDIQIKINKLTFGLYHRQCNLDVYTAYSENYDATCGLYDAIKRDFEAVQKLVIFKVITTDFTESELNVFDACIKAIKLGMKAVESNLSYYDKLLKIYKDEK